MCRKALLRVIHRAGNKKSPETLGGILDIGNFKACSYSARLSSTCHTYSDKVLPPKCTTPFEIMGANYIQTTTSRTPQSFVVVYLFHDDFEAVRAQDKCIDKGFLKGL